MSQRRKFLQSLFFMPAIAKSNMGSSSNKSLVPSENNSSLSHRFKISLNAYSFNAPLTKKEIKHNRFQQLLWPMPQTFLKQ